MYLIFVSAASKARWTSVIYEFFKDDVKIMSDNGRNYYFFACAATHCKLPSHGVRRYLDSKDMTSTSNLRTHAERCWGKDIVEARLAGAKVDKRDGSIFAAFAAAGQRPITVMHRTHTNDEVRYVFILSLPIGSNRSNDLISLDAYQRDLCSLGY